MPFRQKIGIVGLTLLVYVYGMYSIFWGPLDQKITGLLEEIAQLDQESQAHVTKIELLKEMKSEISELRKTLGVSVQGFPTIIDPQNFRRDVESIGKQTGVTVRLWKPKQALSGFGQEESSLSIAIKIEGSFHQTAKFLDELLRVSWVQSLESMLIVRNQRNHESSNITTNFILHGFLPLGIQQIHKLLET